MTVALPAITLTPGIPITVQLANMSNIKAIKLTNGTPFDITVSGFGVQGTSIVPAGTEYRLYAEIENSGSLNLLAVNNVGATGNGVVNLVVYDQVSILPPGNWPVTVPAQTVSANVSTVQTLSNETSVSGTLVIDMGVPGNTNLVQIYNDGHAIWSVLQGLAVHQVFKIQTSGNPLQLGKVGDNVEVLGGMFVDGAFSVTGNSSVGSMTGTIIQATSFDSNTYNDSAGNDGMVITPGSTTRIASAGQVVLQVPGGSTKVTINGTDVISQNQLSAPKFILTGTVGNIQLYTNGLSRISAGTFAGTGASGQLVNHGLGAVPNIVLLTTKAGASTSTSGADTYTSTQFTATTFNAVGFAFLAMRF